MTLGTFAVILSMRIAGHNVERISDLAGLARTDPFTAFFFAMLMFSLAGIPPLAGFFAKWYVFNAAIQAHLYPLAVIGVLSSAVAAYYYLRIVKIMYFDEAAPAFDRPDAGFAHRACGDGPSHAVLVRLSGSFHRRHDGRGQIVVLRPSLLNVQRAGFLCRSLKHRLQRLDFD